ncbi:SprT family zinc-dependent metalloprotease [Ferrimonas sp. YFM]|uniref:SprT family zinc-dependent metalloprotease n=1 Tax=Ferrimonas sp. YFM TaxID=3028878 RepID=UPI0025731CF8|nr:SprT family zinc-dependent metalloprotease [Ferrimonas sp. YFM]BDY03398.1 protein SprT [Ferrimonas sp. YFM]
MTELPQALAQRVEACYLTAERRLGQTFPRPQISLKLRGQSAGAAHLQENRLRFNPVLLAENPDAFLAEVVPHEVAHLLAWQLHGRVRPHGPEWQVLMSRVFDCAPRARHSFDISSVAPATFPYRCGCQDHALTVRRHNKVRRGQARYICRLCNQPLKASQ